MSILLLLLLLLLLCFYYYLVSCTLLQYCNKFTVMQIKLVVVVVVVVVVVGRNLNTRLTEDKRATRIVVWTITLLNGIIDLQTTLLTGIQLSD